MKVGAGVGEPVRAVEERERLRRKIEENDGGGEKD